MCVCASKVRTEQLQKKTGKVAAYKAYVVENGKLRSPYRTSSFVKGPGEITSSRPKNAVVKWKENYLYDYSTGEHRAGASVDKGIHTYLTRSQAESEGEGHFNSVVVKLEADYADLVGVAFRDKDGEDCTDQHAVFTKVTLSEKEWEKVFPLTAEQKAAKKVAAAKTAVRKAAAKKGAATKAKKRKAKSR